MLHPSIYSSMSSSSPLSSSISLPPWLSLPLSLLIRPTVAWESHSGTFIAEVALKLLDKSPSDRHLTTLPPSSHHHHQHALFNSYSKPKVIHTTKTHSAIRISSRPQRTLGSLKHRHHQSRNSPLGFGQALTNPSRLSFTGPETIASPLNCSG